MNLKYFKIRNWKRIQNHFIDPTELLTILTNFREKALNNRISQGFLKKKYIIIF